MLKISLSLSIIIKQFGVQIRMTMIETDVSMLITFKISEEILMSTSMLHKAVHIGKQLKISNLYNKQDAKI